MSWAKVIFFLTKRSHSTSFQNSRKYFFSSSFSLERVQLNDICSFDRSLLLSSYSFFIALFTVHRISFISPKIRSLLRLVAQSTHIQRKQSNGNKIIIISNRRNSQKDREKKSLGKEIEGHNPRIIHQYEMVLLMFFGCHYSSSSCYDRSYMCVI